MTFPSYDGHESTSKGHFSVQKSTKRFLGGSRKPQSRLVHNGVEVDVDKESSSTFC